MGLSVVQLSLTLSLILSGVVQAQTVSTSAQTTPSDVKTVTLNLKPKSTITFSLSPCTTAPGGGTCSLDLSLTTSRLSPSGVQFDLVKPASVTWGTPVLGPTGTAAQKSITCTNTSTTTLSCIIFGINQNLIGNGVVASIPVTATATSTITLPSASAQATNAAGNPLLTSVPNGSIQVTVPLIPALASYTCSAPDIEPGESITCTLTLTSPALASGTTVSLTTTDATKITIPASISVASGATTATFPLSGK